MKRNRIFSYLIIILTYLIAFIGCYFLYSVFDNIIPDSSSKLIVIMLILDIIATFFVFIVSLFFNNASIYDPYWSVAPLIITISTALILNVISNGWAILIICLVVIWSLRLTGNWAYTFKNLTVQDWRYQNLKEKHPKLWPLISLLGIQLMPTLIVFIAMLPIFAYMQELSDNFVPTGATIIAALVTLAGIGIETIADVQMHCFRKISFNTGLVNDHGLWKVSRHPNYLGEIIFWFGMYLFAISFETSPYWVLIFSPLIVFLMFVYISVPMMEKRQLASKPAYKEYVEKTNMLLIFPKKEQPKDNKN